MFFAPDDMDRFELVINRDQPIGSPGDAEHYIGIPESKDQPFFGEHERSMRLYRYFLDHEQDKVLNASSVAVDLGCSKGQIFDVLHSLIACGNLSCVPTDRTGALFEAMDRIAPPSMER